MATASHHYSAAQVGSRETTGYLRTVAIPTGCAATYPQAFTTVDKSRALFLMAGNLPCRVRRTAKQITGCDAAGRAVTYRLTAKGWQWTEKSAKGKLSGPVRNLANFERLLAR